MHLWNQIFYIKDAIRDVAKDAAEGDVTQDSNDNTLTTDNIEGTYQTCWYVTHNPKKLY